MLEARAVLPAYDIFAGILNYAALPGPLSSQLGQHLHSSLGHLAAHNAAFSWFSLKFCFLFSLKRVSRKSERREDVNQLSRFLLSFWLCWELREREEDESWKYSRIKPGVSFKALSPVRIFYQNLSERFPWWWILQASPSSSYNQLAVLRAQMVGMFEVSLQTKQLLLIGRFFSVFRWITSIFLVNNLCRSLSMWTRDPIEIVISCWSLSWEDEPCTLNWESTAEAWVLCLIYRIKSELKTSQAIRWTWIFTGVFRNKILYHPNKFSFSGVETN